MSATVESVLQQAVAAFERRDEATFTACMCPFLISPEDDAGIGEMVITNNLAQARRTWCAMLAAVGPGYPLAYSTD